MSASTASHHLSPAFPGRAPWGTANAAGLAAGRAGRATSRAQPRDFLAVATPGAGKTTFALTLASYLLHNHVVQQITVVAPTEHLKKQWAEAAARIGIRLDPEYSAGPVSQGLPRRRGHLRGRRRAARCCTATACEQRKTLVILDEIHHAGDSKSWGEACLEAFEPATRRLALTGTPFRSDTNPIPFVAYERGRRRHPPLGRRLHLRLRQRARRRRRAAGHLPRPTAATCAGAPRRATRSPPGSASR